MTPQFQKAVNPNSFMKAMLHGRCNDITSKL